MTAQYRSEATRPTNMRRAMKRFLGLHGKRKTKYRKANLNGDKGVRNA